jgi:hypothetical protein
MNIQKKFIYKRACKFLRIINRWLISMTVTPTFIDCFGIFPSSSSMLGIGRACFFRFVDPILDMDGVGYEPMLIVVDDNRTCRCNGDSFNLNDGLRLTELSRISSEVIVDLNRSSHTTESTTKIFRFLISNHLTTKDIHV